jgi:hypothetical protein
MWAEITLSRGELASKAQLDERMDPVYVTPRLRTERDLHQPNLVPQRRAGESEKTDRPKLRFSDARIAIPMTSAFLPANENTNVPSIAATRNALTNSMFVTINLIGVQRFALRQEAQSQCAMQSGKATKQ